MAPTHINNEDDKENSLLHQPFLLDEEMKTGDILKSEGVQIEAFVRVEVGKTVEEWKHGHVFYNLEVKSMAWNIVQILLLWIYFRRWLQTTQDSTACGRQPLNAAIALTVHALVHFSSQKALRNVAGQ